MYYVKLGGRVLEAIKISRKFSITKLKKDYKNNLIPINILEEACHVNIKNKECRVNLQYLWFCLDRSYVYRNFNNGQKKFKVSFSDTYIDNSEKNKKIILQAYYSCLKPKTKIFSDLCNKSYVSIRDYISGKCKIPIFVFLKSCQLLNIDAWVELDNCKIYSGSSDRLKYIRFRNEFCVELEILINWVKLEGNMKINQPLVSISQNINGSLCFKKLVNYFQKVFELQLENIKIKEFQSRPNMLFLLISSAPLRQILNLRYDISLGYKSREIKPTSKFNRTKEEDLQILSSEIETEGSFARHNKSNLTHCEVAFSTYSKDYSKSVFNKFKNLDYPVNFIISERERKIIKETEYRVSFWGVNYIQKFAFEIIPYFHHLGKINNLIQTIKQEDYLKITRVKNSNTIKKLIYLAKNKCGNFKLLTEQLNKDGLKISQKGIESWVYNSNEIPVYAILKMCKIVGEQNYFIYIPKELSFSLWLLGYIDRKTAENFRGIKEAYKHVEELINSQKD